MSTKSMRRRTVVAAFAVFASVAVLGVRLVDIQVVRAAELQRQSVNARSVEATLFGTRGKIVDDNGVTLAGTVMRYNVQISPYDAKQTGLVEMTRDADRIGEVTGLGGPAIEKMISDSLAQNPKSLYALVMSGIDATMFDKLNALDIPWMQFTKYESRTYPDGAVAGNLVGFVSSEGKAQAGLELAENKCLAGENGKESYQIGADGVAIPGSTVVEKKAKDGGTVETTIESDLQWFSQQQLAQTVPSLGAQFGFVTVADVKTGQLRAVAQYPSVDPNNIDATDPKFWGSMAFSTPFEPGSTFKALTAAALIDKGLATPTTRVLAPYEFKSGNGADLHDSDYHAPERLTLTGVLMLSSNTGMSILGSAMSDQQRYDYLKAFGIGAPTGIDFPGQSDGILNPLKDWDDQTKYATMFGQGVSATQIQMVSAYQTLANGGVRIPLSLIKGCKQADGTVTDVPQPKATRVVSAATAQTTVGMLEAVVNKGELTKQLQISGFRVAAKTGTAQQPDGKGGYLPSYYVSVMGMVPADNPQYVVSVNIGYPTTITSSAAAAPLFRTIVSQVIKTFKISPSTTSAPDDPPYY